MSSDQPKLTGLEKLMPFWREGVTEFNSGRYWEAHERWEQGWTNLPSFDRERIQIAIQVAGVAHLMILGRTRGALSLARAALSKMNSHDQAVALPPFPGDRPGVEVLGAREWLQDLVSEKRAPDLQQYPTERSAKTQELVRNVREKLVARLNF